MPRKGKDTETPDFLSQLRTVPASETRYTAGKKGDPVEHKGLERYGAFHRVESEFKDGFMADARVPLDAQMYTTFITEGVVLGRCPENYDACEGKVSKSSMQLRRKTSQSRLKPEHVARFQAHNIRLHHQVDAPRTLRLAPEFFKDKNMINRMIKTLLDAGFPAVDMFEEQHEKSYYIVSEHTIDDLFAEAKKARAAGSNSFTDDEIREMLELCGTVSIRPTFDGTFAEAWEMVCEIVKNEPLPAKKKEDKKASNGAAKPADPQPATAGADPVTAAMAASLDKAGFYKAPKSPRRA